MSGLNAVKNLVFGRKRRISQEAGEDTAAVAGTGMVNPDDLVGRKGLSTYTAMQNDAQVRACLSIKKASVLARGWEINPVKEDGRRGQEIANFCRESLDAMDGSITRVLWDTCDALAKGYSIQNIVWDVCKIGKWAGKWVPVFIKGKDPEEWEFLVDKFRNVVGLYHVPTSEEFGRSRFVVYSYQGDYHNPYGRSDLRACYRNWWSKDFLIRFWNHYLEKYGAPTTKGKYPRGTTSAAKTEFLRAIEQIKTHSAITIPEDMEIELLETIRQGDTGFRIAVEFHNKEIAKAILNQTLITDDSSNGIGSFALAKVHLDVLRMCLKGLKMDLEQTVMREQVLRPMVAYNFGADVPVPYFSLGPLEERDFEPISRGVKNLVECGVLDPKDPWVKEFAGILGSGDAPGRPETPSVKRSRVDGDTNDGEVKVGA